LLPVGVPVPDPKKAAAVFFDETTGTVLQTVGLARAQSEDVDGLAIWKTTAPGAVPITAEHVGVGIALSGGSSTTCGDALVTCYGMDTGLTHIRGWSSAGSVKQTPAKGLESKPLARSVALEPATPACEDARFSPSFSPAAPDCATAKRAVAIAATIDFGGSPTLVGAKITPVVNGTTGSPLAFDSASPWTARGVVAIPSGSGPIDIDLNWEVTKGEIEVSKNKTDQCTVKSPCTGTFDSVQRHFRTQPELSGPIDLMQVSKNSLERCTSGCTQNIDVKIGLTGTLKAGEPGDDALHLRLGDQNQTQALSCSMGNVTLRDELLYGCDPWYEENAGLTCPQQKNVLLAMPQPWQCVPLVTGIKENQIAAGLNERILGDSQAQTCPVAVQNHWPDYTGDDPRIVMVFLTKFGAFEGTGSDTVPVTGFASFYITGWNAQGNGFFNPCQANGTDDPAAASGEIVGHYISHVKTPNDGGGGEVPCDFEGIKPCTAVLVD
jgi:hypothetical protein